MLAIKKMFNQYAKALFLLALILVTFIMLIELKPSTDNIPYLDKVEHVLVFCALTGIGLCAFLNKKTSLIIGLASYGALIEGLQGMLTITRQASVGDWVADCVGILFGCVIYMATSQLIQRETNK